jgi:hypothetical protein
MSFFFTLNSEVDPVLNWLPQVCTWISEKVPILNIFFQYLSLIDESSLSQQILSVSVSEISESHQCLYLEQWEILSHSFPSVILHTWNSGSSFSQTISSLLLFERWDFFSQLSPTTVSVPGTERVPSQIPHSICTKIERVPSQIPLSICTKIGIVPSQIPLSICTKIEIVPSQIPLSICTKIEIVPSQIPLSICTKLERVPVLRRFR